MILADVIGYMGFLAALALNEYELIAEEQLLDKLTRPVGVICLKPYIIGLLSYSSILGKVML